MASDIETLLRGYEGLLRERDADGHRLGYRLVLGPPASVSELRQIEESLGWKFPEDYMDCATEVGLAHVDSYLDGYGPQLDDRMLAPTEITEILAAFSTWVEDCCSEFVDDPEGAAREQAIRDTLIPFQFVGDGTAWDVYCFVRGEEQEGLVRVIPAYHDDEEMTEWANEEPANRSYGFEAHVQSWIDGIFRGSHGQHSADDRG